MFAPSGRPSSYQVVAVRVLLDIDDSLNVSIFLLGCYLICSEFAKKETKAIFDKRRRHFFEMQILFIMSGYQSIGRIDG